MKYGCKLVGMIPCSDSFGLNIDGAKYTAAPKVEGEGKAKFAA